MNLPENFSFSQHNLQDYVDCRYRFYLKYIRGVEWPAIESEPVLLQEARMELGVQFHQLVQQYFAGVSPDVLDSMIVSDELAEWWNAFLSLDLINLDGEKHAEKALSIPFAGRRLVAKYDLLIRHPDASYTIYDWKTSEHLPSSTRMLERLQSIIYPFVLQSSLTHQHGISVKNTTIEMFYWYPNHPQDPIQFMYSAQQLENDRMYLMDLVNEITQNSVDWFTKTSQIRYCNYCRYRSLCDRGVQAGNLTDAEEQLDLDSAFDIDFDSL